ncbi:MAG: flagellar M-ring protein FliF [Myxococcales bacterium]|nr:flagellar M-ring protein FliF [Myxococcales bacterium]
MNPIESVTRWWQEAAPVARAGIVVGLLAMVGAIMYFTTTTANGAAVPMFVGMSSDDARSLSDELRARKIPYELQDNGTTVAVRLPTDEMRRLRLELSAQGLPAGSVTGWDVFDNSSVTLTEFERKVMYQRALQGELSRTITELPQVESARVHLALPTRSLLERDAGEASASVYISLKRGRKLSGKVAAGIAHLVGSSVPDLSADRIAIMDGNGTMIRQPEDEEGGGGRKLLEMKEERERSFEKDIVELLERTVGSGHVIAKVAVDMDLRQVSETLEQYDPDNATLRKERKTTEETSSERGHPTPSSGIQGNLPQGPQNIETQLRGSRSNSNRSIDTREFAVPRTVRQINTPLGELRRLSIAVLVDSNPFSPKALTGDQSTAADAADAADAGEVTANTALVRPSPELLAALIKNTVGFDENRGDRLEISFVPFMLPDTEGGDEVQYIKSSVETWLWVLIVLMIGAVLVSASLWVTERRRKENAVARYAKELEDKEAQIQQQKAADESAVPDSAKLRQQVRELASKNVAATVEVMKGWLRPTLGRN